MTTMPTNLVEILSIVPKKILINCIEKMTDQAQAQKEWIRFYSPKDDYFEFSNFYKHKIPLIIDGNKYTTVEHYFQEQKYAKDIGKNLEFMELIRNQNTGGQAKMLANPIKKARWAWEKKLKELREEYEDSVHFDAKHWDQIRDSVMLKGLIAKFTQDQHCRDILMGTEDIILSENTQRDHYWGNAGDQTKIGRLGELLMQVRKQISDN